jgi:hypothetical protein
MKKAVFWDIKAQFLLHRRHITSPLQSRDGLMLCKIWGFLGSDFEECRLLGYKSPVPTSQETHYVSATEPSRLMLCKIWSFHGGDFEECRLLGYKSPGPTSQETHYVSATQPSRQMLCKIYGFEPWRSLENPARSDLVFISQDQTSKQVITWRNRSFYSPSPRGAVFEFFQVPNSIPVAFCDPKICVLSIK